MCDDPLLRIVGFLFEIVVLAARAEITVPGRGNWDVPPIGAGAWRTAPETVPSLALKRRAVLNKDGHWKITIFLA